MLPIPPVSWWASESLPGQASPSTAHLMPLHLRTDININWPDRFLHHLQSPPPPVETTTSLVIHILIPNCKFPCKTKGLLMLDPFLLLFLPPGATWVFRRKQIFWTFLRRGPEIQKQGQEQVRKNAKIQSFREAQMQRTQETEKRSIDREEIRR